jgi:hypothetical protein
MSGRHALAASQRGQSGASMGAAVTLGQADASSSATAAAQPSIAGDDVDAHSPARAPPAARVQLVAVARGGGSSRYTAVLQALTSGATSEDILRLLPEENEVHDSTATDEVTRNHCRRHHHRRQRKINACTARRQGTIRSTWHCQGTTHLPLCSPCLGPCQEQRMPQTMPDLCRCIWRCEDPRTRV